MKRLKEILWEYRKPQLPEEMQWGLIFNMADSRQLDIYGGYVDLKRRKFLFFNESDRLFHKRIKNRTIEQYYEKERLNE